MKYYNKQINCVIAINALWSIIFILAVIVPFFHSRGLSTGDIFLLQSIFSIALLTLELPTSIFTDSFSPRTSMLIACVCRGIGATLLVFSYGFWPILLAYIFIALGNCFLSGADLVIIYAKDQNNLEQTEAILGKIRIWSFSIAGLTSILSGFIASLSLDLAIWINMALAWLPLPIALMLPKAHVIQKSLKGVGWVGERLKATIKNLSKVSFQDRLFLVLLLELSCFQFLNLWGVYAYQTLLSKDNVPLYLFGLLYAFYSGMNVIFSKVFATTKLSTPFRYVLFALVPVVLLLSGLFKGYVAIFGYIVMIPLVNAYSGIGLINRFNTVIIPEIRASINSIWKIAGRVLVGVSGFLPKIFPNVQITELFFVFSGLFVFQSIVSIALGGKKDE